MKKFCVGLCIFILCNLADICAQRVPSPLSIPVTDDQSMNRMLKALHRNVNVLLDAKRASAAVQKSTKSIEEFSLSMQKDYIMKFKATVPELKNLENFFNQRFALLTNKKKQVLSGTPENEDFPKLLQQAADALYRVIEPLSVRIGIASGAAEKYEKVW